jgi:hypothetical protein
MNIQGARIMARNCWKMASKFQELSPTAQKVFDAFGGTVFNAPKNWFERLILSGLRKILRRRMDQLILINDPSIQVMILRAMEVARYRSRHVGFVATLCASDEKGCALNSQGKDMPPEEVAYRVRCYFSAVLDVPNYFDDLQQKANHWEGVLAIDYTKEFSTEDWWDLSGEKPRHVQREVPPEEVATKIAKNKSEVMALYRHDLRKLFEKKLSGYYEQQVVEVYQYLDEIFAYLFQSKLSAELIGTVLELLANISRMGHFPENWLLWLSQKHV